MALDSYAASAMGFWCNLIWQALSCLSIKDMWPHPTTERQASPVKHCHDNNKGELECIRGVLEPIVEAAYKLSKDKHANYVVQCILERGRLQDKIRIVETEPALERMGNGWQLAVVVAALRGRMQWVVGRFEFDEKAKQ